MYVVIGRGGLRGLDSNVRGGDVRGMKIEGRGSVIEVVLAGAGALFRL